MEPYLTEDQELEKLKAWWKSNGSAVIYGVLIGVAVVAAVKGWRMYTAQRAEAASVLYEQMMIGYGQKRNDLAQQMGGKLMQDYAATPYAGKAALFLARISFAAGDEKSTRAQLLWAVDNAREPASRHAARLRLARLMEQAGETDAAFTLVSVKETHGFESEYQEMQGDLLVAKGQTEAARAAYQAALKAMPEGSAYAGLLAMKLDNTGGAESAK